MSVCDCGGKQCRDLSHFFAQSGGACYCCGKDVWLAGKEHYELPDTCPYYKLIAVPVEAEESVAEKDCVCGGVYAVWNEHTITWKAKIPDKEVT